MSRPRITVCMPTYGRPELLEEAIESFLRQDWPHKRLIVGNDFAGQTLILDHPHVVMVNRLNRFQTLGEKRNWLMDLAGDDYITHWDDDDIYLPGHLSAIMALIPQFRKDAAKQHHLWYDNNHRKYRIGFAAYMHTVIARRSVFRDAGDYAAMNMNEDGDLLKRMLRMGLLTGPPQAVHEPTFIQRLGSHRHMTDFGDACHEKMEETAKAHARTGIIELHPQWHRDYVATAAASWEALHAVL